MSTPNYGLAESLPGRLLDILALNAGATSLATGGASTFWTKSFPLPRNVTFGWEIQFSSPGTVTAVVELEQGNVRPVSESASDVNWVVQDNKLTTNRLFASIADTALHMTAYAPNAIAFGRLKITTSGANDAATALARARMYTIKNNP